ncbi:hypothetical protein [Sessilibacter corallicola]|uniref:Transcriptional regulator SutA RNAP-binding domain-containing protein n=1 Tax=Sessilibacter corallicola TaxID=2904075 RepID=A0ABQ0AE52_9GAMM|nr:hypothetical protein [Sessilibacter corallicola]MCE2028351.1 hypothetical protein [Sessilibacter corallicola]
MKKPKTKSEVRAEIEHQVQEFLNSGGKVSQHVQGESNQLIGGANPFHSVTTSKPPESRTLVNDEIAAIEARKKPQKPAPTANRRPRKKLIKDDFGQPIRWVWED